MKTYVLDTECYKDYFLIAIMDVGNGRVHYAELYAHHPLPKELPTGNYITFNGINYDFPLISMALNGADNQTLKAASDKIIVDEWKYWHIRDEYGGCDLSHIDHIDIMNVAPGMTGLKTYGARLGSKKLQDLPIEPDQSILPSDRELLKRYCRNDLQVTFELYKKLKPQIELREDLTAKYGVDVRSKSDAQIAEAVIKSELGGKIIRPKVDLKYTFNYYPPAFIKLELDILESIKNERLKLKSTGSVEFPKSANWLKPSINGKTYTLGLGGLHSNEKSVSYSADNGMRLVDRDVASYYPQILLNNRYYPSHLGEDFLKVYQSLVDMRLTAKSQGDKLTSESLKIVINGTFGKLGNMYSIMYAPDLLISITLTGQLSLLMLIERLEENGINVVSANTDGIVSYFHEAKTELFNRIFTEWENETGFKTEETNYSSLHSKDVNNYLALKVGGGYKAKGIYSATELSKNPTNSVISRAIANYLTMGIPISDSIYACGDVAEFLTVRKVNGGAVFKDVYLGKTVRWYYSTLTNECIKYKTNGNKVAKSDNSRPMMDMLNTIPCDLDYQRYIDEAYKTLKLLGAKEQ